MARSTPPWQRTTVFRGGVAIDAEQKQLGRCILRVHRWSPANPADGRFLWSLHRVTETSTAHVENGLADDRAGAKRRVTQVYRRIGWVC